LRARAVLIGKKVRALLICALHQSLFCATFLKQAVRSLLQCGRATSASMHATYSGGTFFYVLGEPLFC
jgi:hypothetical protein